MDSLIYALGMITLCVIGLVILIVLIQIVWWCWLIPAHATIVKIIARRRIVKDVGFFDGISYYFSIVKAPFYFKGTKIRGENYYIDYEGFLPKHKIYDK